MPAPTMAMFFSFHRGEVLGGQQLHPVEPLAPGVDAARVGHGDAGGATLGEADGALALVVREGLFVGAAEEGAGGGPRGEAAACVGILRDDPDEPVVRGGDGPGDGVVGVRGGGRVAGAVGDGEELICGEGGRGGDGQVDVGQAGVELRAGLEVDWVGGCLGEGAEEGRRGEGGELHGGGWLKLRWKERGREEVRSETWSVGRDRRG
jgi:hypothetical protein